MHADALGCFSDIGGIARILTPMLIIKLGYFGPPRIANQPITATDSRSEAYCCGVRWFHERMAVDW